MVDPAALCVPEALLQALPSGETSGVEDVPELCVPVLLYALPSAESASVDGVVVLWAAATESPFEREQEEELITQALNKLRSRRTE